MNNSEYEALIDATLLAIEEAIEASGVDIDYETSSGILTLEFSDASQIIINRQPPVQQLWVAAKAGGFHLNYDPKQSAWITDSINGKEAAGEALFPLLSRLCSQQADVNFTLSPV